MMNRRVAQSLVWAAIALLLVTIMPHDQSLWIDESTTALYARTATIAEFIARLLNDRISDAQYPLGNFSYWLGARLLGTSEYALRTISAFWIVLAVLLMARVGYVVNIPFLPVVLACHAFTWYYGGEVRPYSIQIAFGAGLLLAVVSVLRSPPDTRTSLFSFVIFSSALCTACMLGIVPCAIVGIVVLLSLRRRGWTPRRSEKLAMLLGALYLAVLGIYYAWTLLLGKGSQMIGVWDVGLKNLLFAGYELLGLVGFGPGRYELRELAMTGGLAGALSGAVRPSMLGALVLLGIYMVAAWNLWRKHRLGECPEMDFAAPIAGIVIAASSAMFALGMIVHYPFWGRHLAPIFPFIVFLMALAVAECRSAVESRPVLAAALCVTLLASGLMVRFDAEHARDDYRAAARTAKRGLQSNQITWWSASAGPAAYYSLPLCEPHEPWAERRPPCAVYIENQSGPILEKLPEPDLVITTKGDLFDAHGALRHYLAGRGFEEAEHFTAFSVFRRSPRSHAARAGG